MDKFQKFFVELVQKIVNTYTDVFDEYTVRALIKSIDPILKEKIDSKSPLDPKQLSLKSPTFKYMIQWHDHIYEYRELIINSDESLLEHNELLVDLPINFSRVLKSKYQTAEHIKAILTYFKIMLACCDQLISSIKLSNKSKKLIERNRVIKQEKMTAVKQKIINIIGKDAYNDSIDRIFEHTYKKIDRNKHKFVKGSFDSNDVRSLIESCYNDIMEKYNKGEYSDDELKSSLKIIIKNILLTEDADYEEYLPMVNNVIKMFSGNEGLNLSEVNTDNIKEQYRDILKQIEETEE